MIEFKDVGVRRDGRELFAGASFQLHPGHKVGLTGNNGTGKSTLFALLLTQMSKGDTEVTLDRGEVSIPDSWHVAHMAQEVGASAQTAIDYVLSGDEQWYEINAALNDLSSVSDEQIGVLHQQFDEIDGYRTPTKAAQIMAGLGFNTSQHELPVEGFSGGWRMRLNLAKTLMSRADLMLLDEPTNHLDLDAILWLETWINAYTGLVIVISHDQAFLDATVGHILHVEQQKSPFIRVIISSLFVRVMSVWRSSSKRLKSSKPPKHIWMTLFVAFVPRPVKPNKHKAVSNSLSVWQSCHR